MAGLTRICLLVLILGYFAVPARAQNQEPGEVFRKAHALYSNGSRGEAKALFQKALQAKFALADYSLYYLADIALAEGDCEQARRWGARLKRDYPRSLWVAPATLLRAKCELADKNYTAALETLRRLRAEPAAKSFVTEEALYLQARALEERGEPGPAYDAYNRLRDSYPHSRWTAAARKAQRSLRENFPDVFPFHTLESLAREADRLARERQSGEAATLYKKLINNASEPDLQLRYLTKLAALYLGIRSRDEALPVLEQIARDFPETSEAPKALYHIGQILWNRHDNARALEYFKRVMETYPTNGYADHARYAAADIHEFFGRKEEAIQHYGALQKQSSNAQIRADAGWRLAWLYYRNGDLEAASEAFRGLAAGNKDGRFGTPALYWQARIAERLEDFDRAKELHRQIINSVEESYYQTLSLRALDRLGSPVIDDKRPRQNGPADIDPPADPEITFHLTRARELTGLSLPRLAVSELDEINRRAKPNGRLRSLLMREYFNSRAYGRSLALANQLPASHTERDLYRYPLAFWDLIRQKAQERGLDPYMVLALIRQESLFDAQARSPASALGLMQLIPPTAARVARELGLPPPSPDMLFEPELNIALGTQYLSSLLQRYSNNWFKALAAYNAGEAAVDRWEKEIVTDDIEEFVERIPYIETRGYVKLVLRNHRMYRRLYEPQQ